MKSGGTIIKIKILYKWDDNKVGKKITILHLDGI
jgi:hypothetical protein